jgi:hypothetical protein
VSRNDKGPLNILLALGFEKWDTGGGCTALGFTRPDGQQCMVANDATMPEADEGWDVGFYFGTEFDGEKLGGGDLISCTWYAPADLQTALAVIAAWRVG